MVIVTTINRNMTKFVAQAGLFSVGVALMLMDISSLTFLGLGVVILSGYFSPQRRFSRKALVLCLTGVVLGLLRGRAAFSPHPIALLYPVYASGLTLIWACGLVYDYRAWRAFKEADRHV
jgi:hypothetical protein